MKTRNKAAFAKWEIFFLHALKQLLSSGINITLSVEKEVFMCGSTCSGYFDKDAKSLVVATGYENWRNIFIHEYCHFIQWKKKLYLDLDDTKLDRWYNDQVEISEKEAWELTCKQRDMELDCEKRTVEIIKKWKLDIDTAKYIQEANTYLLIYNICWKLKSWYDIGPYKIPQLVKMMPNKWMSNYNKTPADFEELAIKKCFSIKKGGNK